MMLILAALACHPRTDPYGGWPLWVPKDLSGAEDLGHVPAFAEPGPAGPLTFREIGAEAGLQGVVGSGNTHGVGLGLVDLDGDGWLDLVVANGVSNVTGARAATR
ncbi:MAG: hypothetical protein R3F59_28320, partial [Myxococcota bacterium]